MQKPQAIVKRALQYAKEKNYNLILIDTAGRLHIDEDLMQELVEIKENRESRRNFIDGRCDDRSGYS